MPCTLMKPFNMPQAIAVTLLLRRLMPLQLTLVRLAGIIGKLASSSELQAPSLNRPGSKSRMHTTQASSAEVQKLPGRPCVVKQGEAPLQLDAVRARTLKGDCEQIRTCTLCLGGVNRRCALLPGLT